MKVCAGGCGALVQTSGRCPACSRVLEQRRGTSTERGYGVAWRAFRLFFISLLISAGYAPVCGAALADGPKTDHSRCKAQGLETWASADGSSLHFDHEPPLEDHERADTVKVCNPQRIQLLCKACHSAKTGGVSIP